MTCTRTSRVWLPRSIGTASAAMDRTRPIGRGPISINILGDGHHLADLGPGCRGEKLSAPVRVSDGLAACLVLQGLGLRHLEADAAGLIGAEPHDLIEQLAELGQVTHGDAHLVVHPVAVDLRRPVVLALLVARLDVEADGLDVLGVDTGALEAIDDLLHGHAVALQGLARGIRLAHHASRDVGHVRLDGDASCRRHRHRALHALLLLCRGCQADPQDPISKARATSAIGAAAPLHCGEPSTSLRSRAYGLLRPNHAVVSRASTRAPILI